MICDVKVSSVSNYSPDYLCQKGKPSASVMIVLRPNNECMTCIGSFSTKLTNSRKLSDEN